jgi:hypothetical protein
MPTIYDDYTDTYTSMIHHTTVDDQVGMGTKMVVRFFF